ncbi:MAG: hypothetical protein R3C11_05465 [Planctomycetaceae bacterium]
MISRRNRDISFKDKLRLTTKEEELPIISFFPQTTDWNGRVILWLDGKGSRGCWMIRAHRLPQIRQLVDSGYAVMSADLLYQGEFIPAGQEFSQTPKVENPRDFAGYTFGYNHTVFASRVHDILTLIAFIKGDEHAPQSLDLVGVNGAGPLVAAARMIAQDKIDRAAVVTDHFRFTQLGSYRDPQFLPGVVKYGDLPGPLSLSAPYPLWIGGDEGEVPELVRKTYEAAGAIDNVATSGGRLDAAQAAVEWLIAR